MSCDEQEPLLSSVPCHNVLNSSDIDSANSDVIDRNRQVAEALYLPSAGGNLQIYSRRWYILMLFSLVNVMQSLMWNTWGPLAHSAEVAFGWSLDDIALLTNWGCMMYVVSMVFFSWLMDVKGTVSLLFFVTVSVF